MVSPCTDVHEFIAAAKRLTTAKTAEWQGKKVSKDNFKITKDSIVQFLGKNRDFWFENNDPKVKKCIFNLANRIREEFPDQKMQRLANALLVKTQDYRSQTQDEEQSAAAAQSSSPSTTEVFPKDVLDKILGLATPKDLTGAKRVWKATTVVSKKWNSSTLQAQVNLINENQIPIHELGIKTFDEAINFIQKCKDCNPKINYLDLSKYSVNCDQLIEKGIFDNLVNLHGLVLKESQISDETLKQICSKCPNLQKIQLKNCTGFSVIPELPENLRELTLEFKINFENRGGPVMEPVDPPPLKFAGKLPDTLERIRIKSCALNRLPDLPKNLQVLEVQSYTLEELPELPPNLKKLILAMRNNQIKFSSAKLDKLENCHLIGTDARLDYEGDKLKLQWGHGPIWLMPKKCTLAFTA